MFTTSQNIAKSFRELFFDLHCRRKAIDKLHVHTDSWCSWCQS